ncbi:MAG TPA: UDP-3-O-(3-hydroxymyristoyl)glucosamine N-acyltransferase [Acidobacteriaceae bacterium]|jgi:UDP-3-O-[3-hydroxymyristoyl] glucosamine N-acyltransferase|nr:UDP-3-O-(3-hydroxymyristoyl)glucosamine N-acyltransferase [Acidobacteriaceae bacterium]
MKLKEISEVIGAEVEEKFAARELTGVAAIAAATEHDLVFAMDAGTAVRAVASKAGAVIAPLETPAAPGVAVLRVKDPKFAFALAASKISPQRARAGIHPSAVVDDPKSIGEGTSIGPGVAIGPRVKVGRNCQIFPNVVIFPGVTIGDNCIVQAGAVLGSTGFGYVADPKTGEYIQFPQQGRLVIEDNVEIGANTTIDRGALEETRIGRGTKIDNLVQIGHNVIIGKNVAISAQVGISGSTVVGDGAILAGQVGLSNQVKIGPGAILGGQAGVYVGATVEGPGQLFAGTPARPIKEQMREMATLRRLAKRPK